MQKNGHSGHAMGGVERGGVRRNVERSDLLRLSRGGPRNRPQGVRKARFPVTLQKMEGRGEDRFATQIPFFDPDRALGCDHRMGAFSTGCHHSHRGGGSPVRVYHSWERMGRKATDEGVMKGKEKRRDHLDENEDER